jgi:uncharacterized protein (DUF1697 family)
MVARMLPAPYLRHPMLHIALLRAVNLAGRNKVAMADLRALCTDLGLEHPQSLLQSGNLIFGSDDFTPAELEDLLERGAAERLGLETDFFVRTADEWEVAVRANPFPDEAERDPARLLVLALKDAPGPDRVSALQEAITGREVVEPVGRHAYVVYPDGIGRSRLTTKVIEKHLETRATGRNWNTALKLLARTQSPAG